MAGVPIVVLDTAVAREVYGPSATYVAADDIGGTAAALRAILENPDVANAAMSQATAVLSRYSWDRAAADTLNELERIAR